MSYLKENANLGNLMGAFFMVASMATYTTNDSLVKLSVTNMSLAQALFIRGVFASILLGLIALNRGDLRFKLISSDRPKIALRLIADAVAIFLFLTAIINLPIASVVSIIQIQPLLVTVIAALIWREFVARKSWLFLIIGFLGMIVIIRPGSSDFSTYSIVAVFAVILFTIRDLTTRRLTKSVPTVFVAFYSALTITVVCGSAMFFLEWQSILLLEIVLLALAACFLGIGYITGIRAMRVGQIGFVQPFRYSVIIWGVMTGYFFFGEIPDIQTILGSIIIVVTGCYALVSLKKSGLENE